MRSLSFTAILLASSAGSALAGSYTTPPLIIAAVAPPVAQIISWEGPYAGGLVAADSITTTLQSAQTRVGWQF